MVWPLSGSIADAEGRILGRQLVQRDAHLLLVGLGLGLDGHLDDGIGEIHLLEQHRLVGIGQGLARAGILEAGQRDDVARVGFVDLLALVGVHQIHAADPLFPVARRVGERHAALHRAGIDAAEGDRADVRIVHDLEGDHGERLGVERPAHGLLAGLDVDALVGFAIGGGGQVVDDRVEQGLHALVLEGRAAQHRVEGALDGGLADQPLQRGDVGLLAVEVGRHGVVVHLDRGLDHLAAQLRGLVLQVGRDVGLGELGALVVAVPDDGLHRQEVDDALEARTRRRSGAAAARAGRPASP